MSVIIHDIDSQDWSDIKDILAMEVHLSKCKGGRFINAQSPSICLHCGADDPAKECNSPKNNVPQVEKESK